MGTRPTTRKAYQSFVLDIFQALQAKADSRSIESEDRKMTNITLAQFCKLGGTSNTASRPATPPSAIGNLPGQIPFYPVLYDLETGSRQISVFDPLGVKFTPSDSDKGQDCVV